MTRLNGKFIHEQIKKGKTSKEIASLLGIDENDLNSVLQNQFPTSYSIIRRELKKNDNFRKKYAINICT